MFISKDSVINKKYWGKSPKVLVRGQKWAARGKRRNSLPWGSSHRLWVEEAQ